jgi:hypothetical protein
MTPPNFIFSLLPDQMPPAGWPPAYQVWRYSLVHERFVRFGEACFVLSEAQMRVIEAKERYGDIPAAIEYLHTYLYPRRARSSGAIISEGRTAA